MREIDAASNIVRLRKTLLYRKISINNFAGDPKQNDILGPKCLSLYLINSKMNTKQYNDQKKLKWMEILKEY